MLTTFDQVLDTQNKLYSVYLFTFPNGKRYCGYTSQKPVNRWQNGNGYAKCPLVHRAINKYGWDNIDKKVIFSSNIEEQALAYEKYFIENNNLTNTDYGYNLHQGGKPTGSSSFLTDEGRKKIAESSRNRVWTDIQRKSISEKNSGRKRTPEQRKRMSKAQKNANREVWNKKAVLMIDAKTNLVIKEFESASMAAKAISKIGGETNILKAAKGERKSAYNFKWRLKNE